MTFRESWRKRPKRKKRREIWKIRRVTDFQVKRGAMMRTLVKGFLGGTGEDSAR